MTDDELIAALDEIEKSNRELQHASAVVHALKEQVRTLTIERDEARANARLLAFAYEHDVTSGLVFRHALDAALAYPADSRNNARNARVT